MRAHPHAPGRGGGWERELGCVDGRTGGWMDGRKDGQRARGRDPRCGQGAPKPPREAGERPRLKKRGRGEVPGAHAGASRAHAVPVVAVGTPRVGSGGHRVSPLRALAPGSCNKGSGAAQHRMAGGWVAPRCSTGCQRHRMPSPSPPPQQGPHPGGGGVRLCQDPPSTILPPARCRWLRGAGARCPPRGTPLGPAGVRDGG